MYLHKPGKAPGKGFSLIELVLALMLLSFASLACTSLIVTAATSFQQRRYASQLAHQAGNIARRLRHDVWMSGYQTSGAPLSASGLPPGRLLNLRYALGNDSPYNRYDCSRSYASSVANNSWQVRPARYPNALAELVCTARRRDIASSMVIGMDALLLVNNGSLAQLGENWRLANDDTIHAVQLDVLFAHQFMRSQPGAAAPPFGWQGLGGQQSSTIWMRLRLPRAMDSQ